MCNIEDNELSREDKEVIEFLSKYKIMAVESAKEIYKSKWYYRKRINRLVEKNYIKKFRYYYIVLGKKGRAVSNLIGKEYLKNTSNKAYMDRLKALSDIATITINSDIDFIPSWNIKNKEIFTDTARKFLGEIRRKQKTYVVYYISSSKGYTYLKQLIYDINKTLNYNNLILFVDDYKLITQMQSYFIFDKDYSYIIKNTKENKEILKKYNEIDFHDIIQNIYNNVILISDWEKADYIIGPNHYIINMPFIDTSRISEINWFYKENTNTEKIIDVLTLEENINVLKEILTNKCNLIILPNKQLVGGLEDEKVLFKE